MAKRVRSLVHSQRPDKKGRSKDRRHGTKGYTSWVPENRVDPPTGFRHAGKGKK